MRRWALRFNLAQRLIEEHDLDELQIIESADHARGYADCSQSDKISLYRGLEDDKFAPEAEQGRYTGKAEHQREQGPSQSRSLGRKTGYVGKRLEIVAGGIPQHQQGSEASENHRNVDSQIGKRCSHACGGRSRKTDENEANVIDR